MPRYASKLFLPICSALILTVVAFSLPPTNPNLRLPTSYLFDETEAVATADVEVSALEDPVIRFPGEVTYQLVRLLIKKLGGGGSDCWGWQAPDGAQWAIMGIGDGIVFYGVETNIKHKLSAPDGSPCGGFAYWRDMATYQNYCYSVSECSGTNEGLMVIDMSFLPDSVHLVQTIPVSPSAAGGEGNNSHNLSVDTIMGYLYLEANGPHSAYIYDLTDPANPSFEGELGTSPIHDLQVVNDTAYLAHGSGGKISIWTRTHPLFPFQKIGQLSIPSSGYVHNVWLNDDRTILASTEETNAKTVKLWDISDLENITLLGEYLGPNQLAHNAHIQGDRLYLSHYASGIRVIDISDPTNPNEIGFVNVTSDPEEPGFLGCWGVWPHSSDGWVYGSDENGFLHVMRDSLIEIRDSLWMPDVTALPGESVCIEVNYRNTFEFRAMTLPFSWTGALDVTFDSISTTGTRTDWFDQAQLVSFDAIGKKGLVSMVASSTNQTRTLAPGEGPLLKLYFTVPESESPEQATISFGNVQAPTITVETMVGFNIQPDTSSGALSQCLFAGPDSDSDGISDSCDICPADAFNDSDGDNYCANLDNCPTLYNPDQIDSDGDGIGDICDQCAGSDDTVDSDGDGFPDDCDDCPLEPNPCSCCDSAGDADNSGAVTISDVTFLIARIFKNGLVPICPAEGDPNGDGGITIGDVTFLISHIFSSGPNPICL